MSKFLIRTVIYKDTRNLSNKIKMAQFLSQAIKYKNQKKKKKKKKKKTHSTKLLNKIKHFLSNEYDLYSLKL